MARDGEERSGASFLLLGGALLSMAIVAAGFMLDKWSTEANIGAVRQHVAEDLRLVRSSIESRIAADTAAANHLADMIAADPTISTTSLTSMAKNLVSRTSHIDSVVFRPGARPGDTPVVNMLGDHTLLLDVPVLLAPDGADRYWGSVVLSMNTARTVEASGIADHALIAPTSHFENEHLAFAIREVRADGSGRFLFGSRDITREDPVVERIDVPGGSWELLAAPIGGWQAALENRLPARLGIIAAVIAMIVPVVVTLLLLRERNRNIARLKAREEALFEVTQRLNLAMDTSNIGIWELEERTGQFYWDERAAALHGCEASEVVRQDRLDDWYHVIHPEDRETIELRIFDSISAVGKKSWDMQYRIVLADGTIRHLRSVGAHSIGAKGVDRQIGIVFDVTADAMFTETLRVAKETSEIKNAELELALDELSVREHQLVELSQKLDLALASYNCGIWEGDPTSTTAIWDDRMHQLYNVPNRNRPVTRHEWLSRLHPDDRQAVQLATNRALNALSAVNTIQRILLPNNELRYVRSVGQVHIGKDGKKKIIGIAFDVSADAKIAEELRGAKAEADARNIELELAKNRIEFNALHDPLTSLANRRKLDMELEELTREGGRQRTKFSILHLDLDRFKEINDTLGHAAGDAMLVHASRVLTRTVNRGDLIARIGGDEFVILAKRQTSAQELAKLSETIIREMCKPIDFEGFSCRCGVSIGIAQSSGLFTDAGKVLINADIALYQAKEKGRNRFEFFTPDLQANIIARKRMADEILAGLDHDEFTVWYQPQFEANSMELIGAEALVRWRHPVHGILPSNEFLKVAEELNVLARIDQLVLETALKDQMRWTALGVRLPRISVNVSSRRLHDENLVAQLEGLSITPGSICFELIESIFLDESDDVTTGNIERIKALGIDIEIDDFGTGHTSIVSLLRLKPKRLKIDRQLVMPIVTSPQERALVRSIIEIARSLGVETVAEGVESNEHATLLRQLGCDFLQGYAFAKPLPFEDFTRFAQVLPERKVS
ncbi:diguanylate cyclase [Rhizobium sp. ACO-34A]|nr:EAL domain-containing protein [Rhizobium sp. ACO-34A]ATN33421.1 diguanylate cyclase [Rhizobium sp. ACO-34A]